MPKTHSLRRSFNAGELSRLMDQRYDQEKHLFGCRTLENFYPLIYGAAERRPGTQFIASQKTQSAKARVEGFEHSVDDTYVLQFENQVIRVLKDGAQVLDGVGTEDLSGLDNIVAHWKLNDNTVSTVVIDSDGATHNGVATDDTIDLHADGKVGTGSFDLAGTDAVEVNDSNDFSFDDSGTNPFSLTCWANVTQQNDVQVLLSKWKEFTLREWKLSLTTDRKLQMEFNDDSVDLAGDTVSQWKLNDNLADTVVLDARALQNGVATANTDTLSVTGKINLAFDLKGTQAVEIADNAAYSFGDGSDDSAMSIGAWIFVTTDTDDKSFITKWDAGVGIEWAFAMLGSTRQLQILLADQSENVAVLRRSDVGLTTGWHFVCFTYDGAGGPTAADTIKLYVDGSEVASTATPNASYDSMEDTATKVVIGGFYTGGVLGNFLKDTIDNVMIFDIELSTGQISSLYNSGSGTEDLTGAVPSVVTDNAISAGWHFLAMTYDSTGGATAANGVILYVDGVAVDSTATNDADYVAMENTNIKVRIGAQLSAAAANEKFWGDKIDDVAIFKDVLTPTEIASLITTTPFEIQSPYLTADLPTIDFKQSADVMFLAHSDYESRRLSRTGDTAWSLDVTSFNDGPFREENTDSADTITASATTGSVTLTAVGHSPFALGTVSGHEPSGSDATSKSQTGALYKLIHALDTPSIGETLDSTTLNAVTSTLEVAKGVTWDFTTNGTWGTGGPSSVVLERSYDAGVTYETLVTVTSLANKNITTTGTEEDADAIYRARVSDGTGTGDVSIQLSVRDTSHIGIVQITSVESPQVAIGTVLTTIGSTDPTHRWSEGAWSNRRGWPITVDISPEERLTYGGSASKPLTSWGSVIGDFTSFKAGVLDDDAITFTLIGSGQQNTIRWMVPRTSMMIGTVGGEHLLGASNVDQALTPTNVTAKLKGTRGSERIQAMLVNDAILFVQRGGRKVRELSNIDTFDATNYRAEDLTVFANEITDSGIIDWAYQRTPDPMLWCVRDDGQLAIMVYEKQQNVFGWCRVVLAGTDAKAESVTVIYGGAGNEDEVWVTVSRTVNSATVRNVERLKPRDWGDDIEDAFFVDSGITYDSTATTTITGLGHLEGETVSVFADGLLQADKTVSSGQITITSASVVQVGLNYISTLKPMKLDLGQVGLATTKRINRAFVSLFKTIGGQVGRDTTHMNSLWPNGITTLTTGDREIQVAGDYERNGDIIIRQTQALPMTVVGLTMDMGAERD